MFKPKLVSVLCHFVGLMLVLKFVLVSVMFVWGFFGQPLIPVVDPGLQTHLKFLFFLQDVTMTFFAFAVVAAVKKVAACGVSDMCCGGNSCGPMSCDGACEKGMDCACGDKECDGECMNEKKMPAKKAAPRRRVASKD